MWAHQGVEQDVYRLSVCMMEVEAKMMSQRVRKGVSLV